jgi:hypothetical protein
MEGEKLPSFSLRSETEGEKLPSFSLRSELKRNGKRKTATIIASKRNGSKIVSLRWKSVFSLVFASEAKRK